MDGRLEALDVIERQIAVLVRNLEMLYRRTGIHDDLDPVGLCRMQAVRSARAVSLADLFGGWTEEELRTLGSMFTKYNGAMARKFLAGAPGAPVTAPAR